MLAGCSRGAKREGVGWIVMPGVGRIHAICDRIIGWPMMLICIDNQ